MENLVIKLRSFFLSSGCDRLSYLFECIYYNLNRIQVGYLRLLFERVEDELQALQSLIDNASKPAQAI